MLHHACCRRVLLLPRKALGLTPKMWFSSSLAEPSPQYESDCTPHSTDLVQEIFKGFNTVGIRNFLSSHPFRTLIPFLNASHFDIILNFLRRKDKDSAIVFFNYLQNVVGFKPYNVSQFIVWHILAQRGRLKELRGSIKWMLKEEEGRLGSAHSLCELLWNSFRDWDSTCLVWDMLANVYSEYGMVDDTRIVLGKMRDFNFQPSVSTYNNLMHHTRHTEKIWEIFEEMIASRVPWSEYTNSIVIDGLCKQFRLRDAVNFFKENEIRPCVVSFNTLISGLCKMGFMDVAQSFFALMLKFGTLPDEYSYNTMIHSLCSVGSLEEALKFSEDMEGHEVEPDLVTYNILVYGFRLHGLRDKIIKKMLGEGLNPDQVTYTMWICHYCQRDNIDEVCKLSMKMLAQGFQMSMATCSVVLSCLCRNGHANEALNIFDQMQDTGLEPDFIAYSILLHGLCKEGEMYTAMQVYRKMQLKNIGPLSFAQYAIISGLCKKGMIVEAREYLDNLPMTSDIILYNIMLDGYVKTGYVYEAVQLYWEIIDCGLAPNIVTYNTLMYGFCKIERLDKVKGLLQTLIVNGLVPTVVTYTILMDAYSRKGDVDVVLELLYKMKANALAPNVVTYTVVIKELCKKHRFKKALQVFEEIREGGFLPDQIAFNTLIHGFCKVKDTKFGFRLLDKMRSRNLQPNHVTCNILINGLCISGNIKDADAFLNILCERDIRLTKPAYTTIIKVHCVKGNLYKAVTLFNQMRAVGYDILITDYSAVINRLCKRRALHVIKIFLNMMFLDGIFPDHRLCYVMMDACSSEGDCASMLILSALMIKIGIFI